MSEVEYWHLASDGEGCAGPFSSVEDARADAKDVIDEQVKYYHKAPQIKIVKVVSESSTKVAHDTTWTDEP